jgi:hypothetical protein
MRRSLGLGLLALALAVSTAAWADKIDLTNTAGTVSVSNSGIVTIGSELVGFDEIKSGQNHSLGRVSFSTGAFISGSLLGGGTLSATGSTFDVTGVGLWAKKLTGSKAKNPVAIFTGSFIGPVSWTLESRSKGNAVYALSGTISGMLYNGRMVIGTTSQTIDIFAGRQIVDNKGVINMGGTNLSVPESGTLGLLGTGLLAIAATMRRKLFEV